MRWYTIVSVVFSFLFFVGVINADVRYTLTDLGTLGGSDSRANGINNSGVIVGTAYTNVDEISHAYRFSHGILEDLYPTGHTSSANDISESGFSVGFVSDSGSIQAALWNETGISVIGPTGTRSIAHSINQNNIITGEKLFGTETHAFYYNNGTMIDVGTLGGGRSVGFGINSRGTIVGSSLTNNGNQHAFTYLDGGMTDLGTLGGDHSQAEGINDRGDIVGWAWNEFGHSEAFLYSGNAMQGLGTFGGISSVALDINENGDIVGWWSPDGLNRRAFLYTNSEMIDLTSCISGPTGWTLVEATKINDHGQIVGYGLDPNGIDRGFLLTPIPSPASGILFVVLLLNSRRNRK